MTEHTTPLRCLLGWHSWRVTPAVTTMELGVGLVVWRSAERQCIRCGRWEHRLPIVDRWIPGRCQLPEIGRDMADMVAIDQGREPPRSRLH